MSGARPSAHRTHERPNGWHWNAVSVGSICRVVSFGEPRIVLASNRGPVALVRRPDGTVVERRGIGGLVTAVGGAIRGRDVAWVAAAITEDDRKRAAEGPLDLAWGPGASVRVDMIDIEPDRYDSYYNEFSNRILWFLHHYLWASGDTPEFASADEAMWRDYAAVNEAFTATIARECGAGPSFAMVQDYHLSLVPGALRAQMPQLPIGLFWHIPFCQPDQFSTLPDSWGRALLEGMLGADLLGFQTERWAANFLACCREVVGAEVHGNTVVHKGQRTRAGVYPIGVDAEHLHEQASAPEVARAEEQLRRDIGDRQLVLRVDRTELSKNILRGLIAWEMLLERRTDLHGRVVHLALLTPSRRNVVEYQEYTASCVARAQRINERFGSSDWLPVDLRIEDDYPSTLAAYKLYDVLVVNPVYDGMNLVAREGPVLNEKGGALVLSRNAGAAAELAASALVVNPFDTADTAAAIERALDMGSNDRRALAARLLPRAKGTSPVAWLDSQLRDLSRTRDA
ncbi:MAG TPA: trehalose-6-phosphate synthase [Actinomycetota bacterium]|nr:trehalose-6-phosphate synthase [Actinomycetota bacterium]